MKVQDPIDYKNTYTDIMPIFELAIHECERVYSDKMLFLDDKKNF